MHSRPCRIPLFLVALLLAGPALAQPYTFQLPAPTAAPVSRVRVMLDLDAAPAPGAAIEFAGTSIFVGDAANLTGANAGDTVAVFLVPGTNSLVIDLAAKSVLAPLGSGVDFCAVKTGVDAAKSYSFSPVGLPAINGYRITGYRASPATCGKCANRRVDTVTWVAGSEPPGQYRGRLPLDIALVLDRSGSMWDATPGDVGPMAGSKWSALQRSIEQFVGVWRIEGLGAGTAGGIGIAKDRLGLVYFESASQVVPFPGGNFVERGSGAGTHPWDAINARVQADNPLGGTALGSGLKDAINTWRGLPADGKFDLAIVLMTDGMQNVPPYVNKRASDGRRTLDLMNGEGEQSLGDLCIPILAVSVGVPGAMTPHGELLTEIAQQTAGNPLMATSSTLASSFLTELVAALKGNTLATLAQKQAVLPASSSQQSTSVEVDATARSIYVALSARPGRFMPLGLRARKPGGALAQPSAQVVGRSTLVQRFEMGKLGPPGTWAFDVLRNPDAPGDQPYELSVLVEERSLDFGLHIEGDKHPAGKPLTLNAEVIFDGKPLSKEQDLVLSVAVERPMAALGTLLHTTKMPSNPIPRQPGAGTTPTTPGTTATTQQQSPDVLSPYQRKLEALALDPEFRKKLESLNADPVQMKRLENGRFTLTYADTKIPGTYRFHVLLEGKSADGIPLRRIETVETAVEVIPDGPSSTLESAPAPDGSPDSYVLTLVLKDALDNVKGPGYEDQLRVTLGGNGKVVSVTTPEVDGTYKVLVTGVQKDTPIEIAMGDAVIARGTVTKLEPVKPGTGPGTPDGGTGNGGGKGKTCGHCGATGDMMLLYALPLLLIFVRRRSRRA
ncbi:vWA domain-containing protein [Pyxidicoccus sp. MSG2]|uniref:vWA domain-containing protein n=1 Tax=Pyxidicoccus sp. MSG2 TaxID=2996790 RepID=UPI002271DD01|nr:vWA domain-containing protein [Pyxidicoccus sp. MSG2]MCY1022078.1 VWA domain-containing protein [Pyxidicoccus sp. MSG2]